LLNSVYYVRFEGSLKHILYRKGERRGNSEYCKKVGRGMWRGRKKHHCLRERERGRERKIEKDTEKKIERHREEKEDVE
jgi:hypothetical protein